MFAHFPSPLIIVRVLAIPPTATDLWDDAPVVVVYVKEVTVVVFSPLCSHSSRNGDLGPDIERQDRSALSRRKQTPSWSL